MKLPKTLDGNRVKCLSMAVNQSIIPLSNATIEVLKEDALPIRTYVEITTPNGITEIYRTRQPQTAHNNDITTIQLDHAICEVGDYLIQDAIQEEKTVAQAFSTVFSHYRGTDWQLGTITASETVTLDVDYDNVLESLLAILEQVPQYYMTFDFTTTPWTLGIAQKSDTVTAEGRLSRNIESAVIKYDDKDQCTRVYVKGLPKPSGREEDENAIGYMDAPPSVIEQYGIIEKETGSGNLTQEQAERIATAYLNAHKSPRMSVEITGYDLSDITGESLDSYVCGKKFRLSIPEDELVITDYITKVSFQDAINSDACNVFIGDEQDAAINFLQAQASSTKSSRSSSKKQQKLDDKFEKNFEITDEYGAILLQAGMKLDAHGMLVYARDNANNIGSILDFTSSQIMTQVESGDLGLQSAIYQTASAIRTEVNNSLSDVHSSITQTADEIYSEVHASNSQLYSYVDQTATYINSVVESVESSMGSAILQTASQIRSEVHAANSSLYSYIDQTATYINSVVESVESYMGSAILQTASQIRSEVHAANSTLYSYVDQTATSITAHIESVESDIGSEILQTASQIRSEVHAANSSIYSYVDQTASGIRQEVANTESGLQSSIQQQASRINLIVEGTGSNQHIKPAQIQAAIDAATGSSKIVLSADNIELDGDTISEWIYGENVVVGSLEAGDIQCDGQLSLDINAPIVGADGGTSAFSCGDIIVDMSDPDPDTGLITVHRLDGTYFSFRKAAPAGNKINGSWGGNGTLTVGHALTGYDSWTSVITPDLLDYTVPGTSNHLYYIQVLAQDNDAQQPSQVLQYQYNLGLDSSVANRVVIRQGSGSTRWNGTAYYDIPLRETEITQNSGNSWVNPGTGYVGFSRVKVNVPVTAFSPTIAFNVNSGQYSLAVTEGAGGNPIPNTTVNYKLGLDSTGKKVQIQNSSGSKISSNTPEYTIPNPTVGSISVGSFSAPYTYTASVTVNGASHSNTVNVPEAFANGWTSAFANNNVELVGSPASPTYGNTYTVTAKAYTSNGAQAKSNISGASISITIPADRYSTGQSDMGYSATWGTGSGANVLTVAKQNGGTKTNSTFTVTAGTPTYSYNSSTHKYSLTGTALVNNSQKASAVTSTGTEAWDAGVIAGNTEAGISESWGTGSGANVLTVSRALSGTTKSKAYTITAGVSASYNSSTHKYSITGKANVNSTQKASSVSSTGTEAWDAGHGAGWDLAYGKMSIPVSASYGSSITVKFPSNTHYNQDSAQYDLSVDNSYAYIKLHSNSNTVARVTNTGYTNGYTNGSPDGTGTVAENTSGTTWKIAVKRNDGTEANTWIDCRSIYNAGYIAGWAGYYNDSHWDSASYNSSTQKYECWIPSKTVTWNGSSWVSGWDYSKGSNGWFQYTNSGGSSASYALNSATAANDWPSYMSMDQFFGSGVIKADKYVTFPASRQGYKRYVKIKVDSKWFVIHD